MNIEFRKPTQEDIDKAKVFDWNITIYDDHKPYNVCRIEGCYHAIGGKYGNNCLYTFPRDEKPTLDNIREFNGDFAWSYTIEQRNRWKKNEMMSGSYCKILFAGQQVYELWGSFNYLSHEVMSCIAKLQEHPIGIQTIGFEEKEVIGRKVWFNGKAGIITSYIKRQGSVIIEPEEGVKDFGRRPDQSDKDYRCSFEGDIKEDILASSINWFRD